MSEQVVEYLYHSKKESLENIKKIINRVLSTYSDNSYLQCECKGKKLKIDYEITPYNQSLHVIFKYNKVGKIGVNEVCEFQNLLKKINIDVSKEKVIHTTLLDTNSLFFYKRILPHLHNYEWSMRKLIYLVSSSHFSEDWIKETISEEVMSGIKKKQKGKFDSKNLLQSLDLSDYEEYLFGKNYIKIVANDEEIVVRFKELGATEILDFFPEGEVKLSKPYSLWEDVFNEFVDVQSKYIQSDMKKIREGRNIVGHNKEITEKSYRELLNVLKRYVNHLDKAFHKILTGNVNNIELDNMADDFEGYFENQLSKNSYLTNDDRMKKQISSLGIDYTQLDKNLSEMTSLYRYIDLGTNYKRLNKSLQELTKTTLVYKNIMLGTDFSQVNKGFKSLSETASLYRRIDLGTKYKRLNESLQELTKTFSVYKNIMSGTDYTQLSKGFKNLSETASLYKNIDLRTNYERLNESLQELMKTTSWYKNVMLGIDTTKMGNNDKEKSTLFLPQIKLESTELSKEEDNKE